MNISWRRRAQWRVEFGHASLAPKEACLERGFGAEWPRLCTSYRKSGSFFDYRREWHQPGIKPDLQKNALIRAERSRFWRYGQHVTGGQA